VEALFWLLLAGVGYAYAGYPALLWLAVALGGRRPAPPAAFDPAAAPPVAVLVPAHNEEAVLRGRLENLLALRYPPGRLAIIVGSDASTDTTAAVARSLGDPRIRVVDAARRRGKTALLNDLLELVTADLVVFTDANARFDPDALRHLVAPFARPQVGCVVGELVYVNRDDPGVRAGEGLYWRLENAVKDLEGRLGGTLVATGAIYAMRRRLCRPLPPSVSDDSLNPLLVLAAGHEVVVERRARAFEKAATSLREEFERKARMVTRQLAAYAHLRYFLSPCRPLLAARLASHKLLRWLVPFLLLGALAVSLALADRWPYRAAPLAAGLGALAFAVGAAARRRGRPVPFPLRLWVYFCVVNAAAARGVVDFLRGRRRAVWAASATTR
jgi:cellulose synthase/poly-beta-1,6-N-acetylglucosamine synthase-like glycosyltransferase